MTDKNPDAVLKPCPENCEICGANDDLRPNWGLWLCYTCAELNPRNVLFLLSQIQECFNDDEEEWKYFKLIRAFMEGKQALSAKRQAEQQGVDVAALKREVISWAFAQCQPDRGDVFGWLDDNVGSLADHLVQRGIIGGKP